MKHLVKLNAQGNQLTKMLDFAPPASLEWVDLSNNRISKIENVVQNQYLRCLFLENNSITKIEGLDRNVHLRVLSLNSNQISKIENIDNLHLEELCIADNQLTRITGLSNLPDLRTLDLSRNEIAQLKGLEHIDSLRFLNLSLNKVSKVLQLRYIDKLDLLTELDLCFNPIQNRKYYYLQVLYHLSHLRMLDGVDIIPEDKVKAENLHSVDLNDRETIFKTLLPQENFVDRRVATQEMLEVESDDADESLEQSHRGSSLPYAPEAASDSKHSVVRRYVGELIQRVEFGND